MNVDQSDRAIYLWRERELRRPRRTLEDGGGALLPPLPKQLSLPNPDMDLWLADSDGSHAQFLHNYKGGWIKSLGWSPDGSKLFTQLKPYIPDHQPHPSQIQILDLKSRQSWQIADRDEEFPVWDSNSQALFFWRKMADAVITPEGSVTSYPRWQLFRTEAPWERPTVQLATQTPLSHATPISPDGKRLLYLTLHHDPADGLWHVGPAVLETLATGQTTRLFAKDQPIPERPPGETQFDYPSPLWSGDAHWLFHTTALRSGRISNLLFDLRSAEQTELNPLLNAWGDNVLKRTEGESLGIRSAAWICPSDNLLLLEVYTFAVHPDFRVTPLKDPPPKHGWAVYDPTEKKLLTIEGMPEHTSLLRSVLMRLGTRYCLIFMSDVFAPVL